MLFPVKLVSVDHCMKKSETYLNVHQQTTIHNLMRSGLVLNLETTDKTANLKCHNNVLASSNE